MKHANHILAFDKQTFSLEPGFNPMTWDTFCEKGKSSLMIARREELESDERFGQLLPYVTLFRRTNSEPRLFTCRRSKGIGESRLLGNSSIGMGGHVDLLDVVHVKAVIDFPMTLHKAMRRELGEEVGFHVSALRGAAVSYDEFQRDYASPAKMLGMINDTSNEVGRVHYGVWFGIEVPSNFEPFTLESELVTIGMQTVSQLAADETLESWSKLLLQQVSLLS